MPRAPNNLGYLDNNWDLCGKRLSLAKQSAELACRMRVRRLRIVTSTTAARAGSAAYMELVDAGRARLG